MIMKIHKQRPRVRRVGLTRVDIIILGLVPGLDNVRNKTQEFQSSWVHGLKFSDYKNHGKYFALKKERRETGAQNDEMEI